mmetsp:Transcript_43505/g.85168  ORF Transcript_43505/g.85168 Transcript_43505/m.85168 type:complete len:209 (-) Transcript_43505:106-732(-)
MDKSSGFSFCGDNPMTGQVLMKPVESEEPSDRDVISNLNVQLKIMQEKLAARDLIIWKVEQELQEAGIDDLVSSARQVVTRLYDEGEMNNTPRVPDDEKELEALALEAVALLTEKMHYGGEIDIDQRAYVQLAIVAPNGQDHYRIQDVVDLFKDKSVFAEDELKRWLCKWTNSGENQRDNTCQCRAWIKRSTKKIEAKYGFSTSSFNF